MLAFDNKMPFDNLKKTIDEKYLKEFSLISENAKREYNLKMQSLLGDSYETLTTKYLKLNSKIKDKRIAYIASSDYIKLKNELLNLKQKLDTCKKEDYDEIKTEYDLKISSISTLNVKINNLLKDEMKEEKECLESLKSLFDSKKEEVLEIKKQVELETLNKIKTLLEDYKNEITELYMVFNEKVENISFPFDFNNLSNKTILNKFEIDYFSVDKTVGEENVKVEFINVEEI